MSKKVVPFLIAVPSLILLFILKIVPAVNSLIISTKDYSPMSGLAGSPGVGLKNFVASFQSQHFIRTLINTSTLSFLSIFFTCVLAALLILCISSMPNRVIKTVSIILVAIPAFVPIPAYAGVFFRILSPTTGIFNGSPGTEAIFFLADKSFFSLIFAVMDALRNVFIPVIIGVLACEREGVRFGRIAFVIFIYALVRATMFMSPDLETLLLVSNPMVYEKSEVFDSLMYRTGMMQMQFSQAGALWVIKTGVQLFVNIALYFIISYLIPRLKGIADTLSAKVNKGLNAIIPIFGYVLLALGSIGVVAAVFFPLTKRLTGSTGTFEGLRMLLSNNMFVQSFFNSLIVCIIGSIIYAFVTLTLALPMTAKTRIYPLLLVVLMSITNNLIGEYVFYRGLGMVNTVFPVILSSLSVVGAFALHFSVSNKFGDETPGLTDYLKASILPLLTIVVLFFISNWGGFLYQMVFMTNRQFYSIGLVGREILSSPAVAFMKPGSANTDIEAVRAAFILLSSIVPAALGTLLISLNKFIPLSAFSVQIRKN